MQILPMQGGTLGFLSLDYLPGTHLGRKGADLFANVLQSNSASAAGTSQNSTSKGWQPPGASASQGPTGKGWQAPGTTVSQGPVSTGWQAPGTSVPQTSATSGWQAPGTSVPQTTSSSGWQNPGVAAAQAAAASGGQTSTVVPASVAKLAVPSMPRSTRDASLRNVKMTQADYAGLADKLIQAGVPKEKVEELGKKVQSPEGLTWGHFLQSVHQTTVERFMKPEQATDDDKATVSSLLSQIGFDAKQSSDLTDSLAKGNPSRAFDVISGKLKTLDPGQTISLSQDEMQALAKTLKLPEDSQQRLLSLFGGQESLNLTPAAMGQAFMAAKSEVAGQLSQIKDALKTVKGLVDPAMATAQQQVSITQQAIDARVQSTQVRTSSLLEAPQNASPLKKEEPRDDSSKSNTATKGSGNSTPQQEAGAVQKDGRQPGSQATGRDAAQDGKDGKDGKSAAERSWGEFVSKLRAEGETQPTPDSRTTPGQGGTSQLGAQAQTVTKGADGQQLKAQDVHFLDQVESGILRNLGQGTRQLSLELSPEGLGKLNVVLTVKGKDVQAVIKADTPEAEKTMSDNLQQLKQTLESQGLTVSKLEVRTSLSQDSSLGQQWAGAEKHNLSQERREALERMRNTSTLAGTGDEAVLAQQMQSSGGQVKNSQGGLDLIA